MWQDQQVAVAGPATVPFPQVALQNFRHPELVEGSDTYGRSEEAENSERM
jgi:hypothetical protein